VICPKCQNPMRTVDRQGIHIDQCDNCRGIFLDRGELESILGAERRHAATAAPPPYQPAPGYHADSPKGHRGGYPDSPKGYRGGYPDSPRGYGGRKRKRRSFLEELFD
jgi:Zn-finger nucleic acid-binding protein